MVSQAVVLSGLIQLKSIHQEEYIVLPYNTKGVYVVDTVSWPNFRLPKGSRISRPPETWLNLS